LGNIVIKDTAGKFAANVPPVFREIQAAGAKSNAAPPRGVEFGRRFRCGLLLGRAVDRWRTAGAEGEGKMTCERSWLF
jgi:hypothetical protein